MHSASRRTACDLCVVPLQSGLEIAATLRSLQRQLALIVTLAAPLALPVLDAHATEGALGRPVAGTSVVPDAGVIPTEPIWVVNIGQIYLDGSIGADRQVPIAGRISLGIEAEASFTLATLLKVWDAAPGGWNLSSSVTVPYIWERAAVNLSATAGATGRSIQQSASDLFDLAFTPIAAGYHFSKTEHVSLSFNVWAPTGQYDPANIANAGLNSWTFIPQVAYTKILPEFGAELDAVAGVQFYTRNHATDYQNAPLFTLDLMALKRFDNGAGLGIILGTVQQLGHDSGPTADRLNGFVGSDWAMGPIVTYDTKIDGKLPLSFSLRWVPTVSSRNRIDSDSTVMATLAVVF